MDKKKFLILLFSTVSAAFIGSFLASYLILAPHNFGPWFMPQNSPRMMDGNALDQQMERRIERQQELVADMSDDMDDDKNDFMARPPVPVNFPIFGNNVFNAGNVTTIKTEETKDAYKIKINLKPFNNDLKNVKVKISGDKVSISAQYKSKDKHEFKSSQFYQSLTLPKKIDVKTVKQEKEGDSLVVTIPKTEAKK